MIPRADIRPVARHLVDQLPDNANWEDLMYQIYVQEAIDQGIAEADAGKLIPHDEAIRRVLGTTSK
jgi:predicted transcriptional regulator